MFVLSWVVLSFACVFMVYREISTASKETQMAHERAKISDARKRGMLV